MGPSRLKEPDPIPALTAALLAYAWADALDDLGLIVLLPAAVLVLWGVNVVMEGVGKVMAGSRRRRAGRVHQEPPRVAAPP